MISFLNMITCSVCNELFWFSLAEKTTDVDSTPEPSIKKTKSVKYSIEAGTKKLISEDGVNKKLWNEALSHVKEGSKVKF